MQSSDLQITVSYGLDSGVQCQRLDARGVGIQRVLDLGLLDAADIWSFVREWVEICFPQMGGIVFLDASTSPRTVTTVESYTRNGTMTCALIGKAGTVVLVSGIAPPPPEATATADAETALSDCMVTTTAILNFRTGPDGAIMDTGFIPFDVTLTALARTPSWFNVDYHGTRGWISADYVTTSGSCG